MREAYSTHLAIVAGILIVLVTVMFALIQSPEAVSTPESAAPAIPHPLEGFGDCDLCHGSGQSNPYPIRHLGWSRKVCLKCHAW